MKWRLPIFFGVGGLLLLLVGWRVYGYKTEEKVEFIDSNGPEAEIIRADISGAVQKPDVYEMAAHARIQDLVEIAGGFSEEADLVWVAKRLNLAAKLTDGVKVYIPKTNEVDEVSTKGRLAVGQDVLPETTTKDIVNINTASKSELEELPGVGPVTADKFITNRPYQAIEDLVTKKVIGAKTLEKIKEMVSVY